MPVDNSEQIGTNELGGDKLMPLLEKRARLKERLKLLESKSREVSEDVFRRVRDDYEARLDHLNREIATHGKMLDSALSDYRELLDSLGQAVELGASSLEELKIRHALGEYDELEYEDLAKQKKVALDLYRQKMTTYGANIERIKDVISQITRD